MSRIVILSALVVASLSSIVGCGSRATQSSTTPASMNVAERDEDCWTPPPEIAMSINEAKAPESAAPAASDQERMKNALRPNRQDRPSSGAVHAATY